MGVAESSWITEDFFGHTLCEGYTRRRLIKRERISFLTNFSSRIGLNVVTKLLSFVTVPLLARAFSPDTFGKWNLIQTIFTFILIPVDFGFNQYGIREIVQRDNQGGSVVDTISSARIVIAIVAYIGALAILSLIFYPDFSFILLIAIISIALFFYSINTDFFFIAQKQLFVPSINQFIGYSIYTILIILFIRNSRDLIFLVGFYAIYYGVNTSLNLFVYRKRRRLHLSLSVGNSIRLLRNTYKIGISTKIEMLNSSLPIIAIAFFLGNYEVGIFAVAMKLFGVYLIGLQTLMLTLAPYFAKIKLMQQPERKRRIRAFTVAFLIISVFSFVGFYFFSPPLVRILFGAQYVSTIHLLILVALFWVPITPFAMLFNSILLYSGFDRQYLTTTIISVCFIVVLIPLLTKYLMLNGTIYAMGIASFVYCAAALYFSYRKVYAAESIVH